MQTGPQRSSFDTYCKEPRREAVIRGHPRCSDRPLPIIAFSSKAVLSYWAQHHLCPSGDWHPGHSVVYTLGNVPRQIRKDPFISTGSCRTGQEDGITEGDLLKPRGFHECLIKQESILKITHLALPAQLLGHTPKLQFVRQLAGKRERARLETGFLARRQAYHKT